MRRKGLRNVETKYLQGTGLASALGKNGDSDNQIGTLGETVVDGGDDPDIEINNTLYKLWPTDPINGTEYNEIVGNKFFVKDFKFRAHLQANTSANAPNEVYVYLMLLRIKSAYPASGNYNTTQFPTVKDVFDYFYSSPDDPHVGGDGRLAALVNWKHYNRKGKDAWTILKYKRYKISKETGADYEKKLIKWNVRVNQPAHIIRQGDVYLPQDGHLVMYWWCDQIRSDNGGVAQDDNIRPTMLYTWRTTFTDI